MSTSPDDRLGELSATERDFLARRMPVDYDVARSLPVRESLMRLRAFQRALSANYPMSGAILSDLITDLEKALK